MIFNYDVSDLWNEVNSRVIQLPAMYGATDINSVVSQLISYASANDLFGKLCSVHYVYSSGSTGYFGTSAFTVLFRFASSDYGFGLLLSDNAKSIATFNTTLVNGNVVTTLHEIGDLQSEINSKQDILTFDNVPTYNSNNPVKSTGIFSNMNNKFARVETGGSASKTYAKGEYVIVNGNLYKASTAIPNGTAFSVGTNIESTTVGAELYDANKPVTFNYAVGGSTLMRVNSGQRKLCIPIPLGYTQATATYYNNNNIIKARKFEDYTVSYNFTGGTISTTINGPTLFVWLNGTGLESYGDLIASQGDLTISLSK